MKNLRKVIAMIMALGTLSTMGLSANAETVVGDSYGKYIAGDVNLDGKLNVSDIIISRRILLHLADPVYLHAEDDKIKVVTELGEHQKTVNVDYGYIDLDNDTISIVDDNYEDLILNFTSDTKFSDEEVPDFKTLKSVLVNNSILFNITYDTETNNVIEISEVKKTFSKPKLTGKITSMEGNIVFNEYYKTVDIIAHNTNPSMKYNLVLSKDVVMTNYEDEFEEITWEDVCQLSKERYVAFSVEYTDGEVYKISAMHIN